MIKPLRFHLHQKCIHMTTCRWSLVENYVKIFIDLLHVILGLGSPSDWLRGCSIGNKSQPFRCCKSFSKQSNSTLDRAGLPEGGHRKRFRFPCYIFLGKRQICL
ncbi:uncharacterized protein LOC111277222 isoform X1 [Durio zibethinus]|uniref:Uncharacterized protein LOC111277222 isoform X1 n=1 Tax=Durio zibethinus TaxID=66656 RepID=A0A6P5WU98_DURZI|nr:uncharacterized protein LOC111277222 isoform X1 [Durio zibethinus]